MVAAVSVAVIDWCQTRSAAIERWDNGRFEKGIPARWVMGATPSRHTVDVYFATSAAVVLLITETIMPKSWRPTAYGIVTVGMVNSVVNNVSLTNANCL